MNYSQAQLLPAYDLIHHRMKNVVVYDLNKTLYRKSSKDEFFKFVSFRQGSRLLNIAQIAFLKILGSMRLIDITTFKENFFSYLNHIDPDTVSRYAEEYWSIEYPFYFNSELLYRMSKEIENGYDVLIITGGLEIYTRPLLDLLPVKALLGTLTKYSDGKHEIQGKACKDEEKWIRLQKYYEDQPFKLIRAYSDDKEVILEKADEGFLVEDGKLSRV